MNSIQPESLYPDDIYGAQNSNCFLTNTLIGDESQSLDEIDQGTGYENQMESCMTYNKRMMSKFTS